MDRATERIEQHLLDERQALQSNLEELENRVRSVVDWRRQFRGNTAIFLGLALGGGLLIGLMTARTRASTREYPVMTAGGAATSYRDHRWRELSLVWRSIESAVIGLGAAKLKDALANALPGLRDHLAAQEADDGERGRLTRYRS
jgi:hypothetical protein